MYFLAFDKDEPLFVSPHVLAHVVRGRSLGTIAGKSSTLWPMEGASGAACTFN